MKRTQKAIIIILILLLAFELIFNGLVWLIPGFFCDYIEYNGVKYYCANDQSLYTTIDASGEVYGSLDNDDSDYMVEVTLHKNSGIRIGIFQKFYAHTYYGDKECLFLQFDSSLYTSDYELARDESVTLGDGTVITINKRNG